MMLCLLFSQQSLFGLLPIRPLATLIPPHIGQPQPIIHPSIEKGLSLSISVLLTNSCFYSIALLKASSSRKTPLPHGPTACPSVLPWQVEGDHVTVHVPSLSQPPVCPGGLSLSQNKNLVSPS